MAKTFLELVQRLAQEAGIGSGPTTVIAQTGEYLRCVNWVKTAYEEIQGVHPDWLFLRKDLTFSTTSLSIVITDLGAYKKDSFRCYLTATGVSDEQMLDYIPWDEFKEVYDIGSSRTQTGRPSIITARPNDNSLYIWPISDADYTVVGEYYSSPHAMTLDTSDPIFPQHHMAIVWKALTYYGAYSSEPDKFAHGNDQYGKLLAKMELSQLPDIIWGDQYV